METKINQDFMKYSAHLRNEFKKLYEISRNARDVGLDPEITPEIDVAEGLAELVEGLVGPAGVAKSIRALSQKLPREELAFKVAEEIIYGKFRHMEAEEAAEQAIRTSLAILTEGITAAPLQGVAKVLIKTNFDKTKYLAIYYAGPIRSAGGTDQALTLVLSDFVRRLLGLDRYKPTEEEINRFIEEIRVYERNAQSRGHFQYHVTDKQLRIAIESIPVEVTGTESDPVEVQSFRNLPRIETNRVRGGALRVLNDGIIGRAAKVSTIIQKLGLEGWTWLRKIGKVEGTDRISNNNAGFMEDIIAGRPVFSFPSKPGGFRLRYGRARNTGLAAVGVNPLTMEILDEFLAGGTQMRIELPGKGGIVMPVDSIEPPIVLLQDHSVVRVSNENVNKVKSKIKKVLFLGDLLVSFGDFLYNNKNLSPPGYTEEWWSEEFKEKIKELFNEDLKEAVNLTGLPLERLDRIISNPFHNKPSPHEAVLLSKKLDLPLHPYYTVFWSNIKTDEVIIFREILCNSTINLIQDEISEIYCEASLKLKTILEKLCLPHEFSKEKIIIEHDEAVILNSILGLNKQFINKEKNQTPFEVLKTLSGITVNPKLGTSIGARMGRPEKAKRREMNPLVHLLFPIGLSGGPKRDLITAAKKHLIHVDLVERKCPKCKKNTIRIKCSECNERTTIDRLCPQCGQKLDSKICPTCNHPTQGFRRKELDLQNMISDSCKNLRLNPPKIIKGVKGLTNENKIAEILEKGILRAKEDLSVYKDGTIRFDATNAPLTHFKPSEIGVPLKKINLLGYNFDIQGAPLKNENQICELKIQDIIIPMKSVEYFIHVTKFIDTLLERIYKLPRYYNVDDTEDLIGHLVIGLAPHTSVGILGRIIGFTNLDVCYAHPLWHSAKRRDCDGDEDALMIALDTLINFSKFYLPSKIGGIMDAPLFIIPIINPVEVQRQAHEFDIVERYPLKFYKKALERASPNAILDLIDLVADKLSSDAQFRDFYYTTPTSNINMGNQKSMYKRLKKMTDKLNGQLNLASKIEAVDAKEVALRVLKTHFLRDISGNLRAFSTQSFRCKTCNRKYRRIPIKGKCPRCGGFLSLTVQRGGIEKYLGVAKILVEKYKMSNYYLHRLLLAEDAVVSLFESGKPRQVSLLDFN